MPRTSARAAHRYWGALISTQRFVFSCAFEDLLVFHQEVSEGGYDFFRMFLLRQGQQILTMSMLRLMVCAVGDLLVFHQKVSEGAFFAFICTQPKNASKLIFPSSEASWCSTKASPVAQQ
jgi:hypothetical protein